MSERSKMFAPIAVAAFLILILVALCTDWMSDNPRPLRTESVDAKVTITTYKNGKRRIVVDPHDRYDPGSIWNASPALDETKDEFWVTHPIPPDPYARPSPALPAERSVLVTQESMKAANGVAPLWEGER